MKNMRNITCVLVTLFVAVTATLAQKQRLSPLAVTSAHYQDNYVKIMYGQPSKKGREIFGGLVPFDEIWRTGANEATELTTTKDIKIKGKILKKGTYSLFTIPQKDKWTIILNADVGLWGNYKYNEKKDVLRFDAPVQSATRPLESFSIEIEEKEGNMAEVIIAWDTTQVSFPIEYLASASRP